MKIKEAYEQQCKTTVEYRDALTYMVLNRVTWTDEKMVTRVGGMPKRMMRVGMVECTDPFVIIHEVDSLNVFIQQPIDVAYWPWPTVDAFPGLAAFLRKTVDIDAINIRIPGDTWVRKVNADAHQK